MANGRIIVVVGAAGAQAEGWLAQSGPKLTPERQTLEP
jgi:hypothetical protein